MNFEEEYKSLKEQNLLLTVTVDKLKEEIIQGKKEIEQWGKEIEELREHLKKYTAPTRSKKYYENHKEEIKEKRGEYNKEYCKNLSNEKKAEYNKKYYLKKKEYKENKTKEV